MNAVARLRFLALPVLVCLTLGTLGCSDDDPTAPGGTGEPVAETVELLLTARGAGDLPLGTDDRGVTPVTVGEEFTLEVGYVDHREPAERLGAFRIFVDLLVDQANVLRPVIGETQRLIVAEDIHTADPAGTVTFALEVSAASHLCTGAEFTTDPQGELVAALNVFGYTDGEDYRLTRLDSGNQDIGLQITWNNARHGNVDMPDLVLVLDFPQSVPSQMIEFAPFGPDGVTMNAAALPFNVDVRSRGFNGNQEFYAGQVQVGYSPAVGFTQVGGQGPAATGGIPELSDDGGFPQPFDAFSLRVEVVAPATGLTITAVPSLTGEALVMYGLAGAVALADIRLDGDHMLTIDALAP